MRVKLFGFAAVDLADTGTFLDKQDPFLKLAVGREIYQTAYQKDAGTACTWNEVFVVDIAAGGEVEFQVLNKNVVRDTLIGEATVSSAQFMGGDGSLEVQLFVHHKNEQRPQGRVSCRYLTLSDEAQSKQTESNGEKEAHQPMTKQT